MDTRLEILDIWVDPVNRAGAVREVERFLDMVDRPRTVFAANPEKNFSVPKDPNLHEAYRRADLLIPDGIGMVVAARILHGKRLSRVPGVEMLDEICRAAVRGGHPVFVYGAREEVNARACEVLQERHPGLAIAGRSHGYAPKEDMDGLVGAINASGARVLFVALGSPMQERWLREHGPRLENVRVCQGIGGSLDVVAGKVRRAPALFRHTGTEWLYRLASEPKRAGRQRVLPMFAARVLAVRLGMIRKKTPPAVAPANPGSMQ
ncbi:MAG: WecB/TagA/CpsF family glycosyltransferase [Desulfatibacillaceae bacterium]